MPPRPADITFCAMNNPNLCNRKHELSQTTANLLTLIAFSCNQARISIFHANLTRQLLKGEEAAAAAPRLPSMKRDYNSKQITAKKMFRRA
jgi:hypothetical protein